jgi:hypothetical protein
MLSNNDNVEVPYSLLLATEHETRRHLSQADQNISQTYLPCG